MLFIKRKSQNKVVYAEAYEGINVTKDNKNETRNLLDLIDCLGLSYFISELTGKDNILDLQVCLTNISKHMLNINILPTIIYHK